MLTRRNFLVSLTPSVIVIGAPVIIPITSIMRVTRPPPRLEVQFDGFVVALFKATRARAIADLQGARHSHAQLTSELLQRGFKERRAGLSSLIR